MLPEVAEPVAELVGEPIAVLVGLVLLSAPVPVELLLPPLELQAASASTPAAVSARPTPPRRMIAAPCLLRDIFPPGIAALLTGRNFTG
jgi:hypothetical protein